MAYIGQVSNSFYSPYAPTVSSAVALTTDSGSYIPVSGMSVTPTVSGSYMAFCDFRSSVNTNASEGHFSLFKNETQIQESDRDRYYGQANQPYITATSAKIWLNGSTDTITLRYYVTGPGSPEVTINERVLNLIHTKD